MHRLRFDKPLLMGILNLTPDSFSDGGHYANPSDALPRIEEMMTEGAYIIDIGAESTFGPESQVSAEVEWGRLEPVLMSLRTRACRGGSNATPQNADCRGRSSLAMTNPFISVDTSKAVVAEKSLELGVQMINDVTAMRGDQKMIDVLLRFEPYVCLMFSADETGYATRTNHEYEDVMKTITAFLRDRTSLLLAAGFPREKIIIDPGLGFFLSSNTSVSWEVINRLSELKVLGFPILIGPSMKSFLGGEIKDRLQKSLEAAKRCVENGAGILRVHEVGEYGFIST